MTIRDIADYCGCSVTTVSRAVNNSGYVRASVKAKILSCISENNWKPSAAAKVLSTGKSGIIGIWLPGLSHYIYRNLLENLRCRLTNTHYKMMVSLSKSPEELEKFIAMKAETVIVFSPHLFEKKDIESVINCGIPVMGIFGSEMSFPMAHSNHYGATYSGTKMLLEAGHRKIAYGGIYSRGYRPGDEVHTWIAAALRGYCDAMKEWGIVPDSEVDLIYEKGENLLDIDPEKLALGKDLLARRHTAYLLFPCSTQMVFYILCRKLGIRIPDDVSMVGVEGDYFLPVMNPPPVCLVHDYDAFADLIMEFIETHGQCANGQYSVDYKLVPGNSIKKLQLGKRG